jgi:hypothetical protein
MLGDTAETILTLSKIAIQLTMQGYSAYQAVNQAKQQENIQRELTAQEVNGIASALYNYYHTKYPTLTLDDWIVYIQLGGDPFIDNGTPTPKETNYWLYVAIFVAILVVIKR